MKRAARFMRERAAHRGGYVWSYLPDFSRRWGEMEAFATMIWMQPPGTATVGHLYLDCFHATGDEFYYQAAMETAEALIAAQHPAGGWNYLHDFAGVESARRWYDTIGKNGWRLEEFHHYYGNATFDDAGTSEASQFLLRLYLERRSSRLRAPLQRAVRFVLESQFESGGWPQRFPLTQEGGLHGRADYTRQITFNDDVAGENIKFLLMVYQTMGDERCLNAIRKAMDVFVATQQPAPQAGWGLQHDAQTLAPIGARTYEPEALTTHTTANNVAQLMNFYEWTGEPRFLARVPEALAWLDSVRLTDDRVQVAGRHYPTFIEIGTNRARIVHRRGSNVVNGQYFWNFDVARPIRHYSQWRAIDVAALRERYQVLVAASGRGAGAPTPTLTLRRDFRLPRFFTTQNIEVSDLNSNLGAGALERPTSERARALIASLNSEGYWPTPLTATSHTYAGDGAPAPAPGDFSETLVGDETDTSPYTTNQPVTGISTGTFIQNMSALLLIADSGE
jgi:PelA/Pel-15E family pectate lyase